MAVLPVTVDASMTTWLGTPVALELAGVEHPAAVTGLVGRDHGAVAHAQRAGGGMDAAAVGHRRVGGDGHGVEDQRAAGDAVDAGAVLLGQPTADCYSGECDVAGCLQQMQHAVTGIAVDDGRRRSFADDRHWTGDVEIAGEAGVLGGPKGGQVVCTGRKLDDVRAGEGVGLLDRRAQVHVPATVAQTPSPGIESVVSAGLSTSNVVAAEATSGDRVAAAAKNPTTNDMVITTARAQGALRVW